MDHTAYAQFALAASQRSILGDQRKKLLIFCQKLFITACSCTITNIYAIYSGICVLFSNRIALFALLPAVLTWPAEMCIANLKYFHLIAPRNRVEVANNGAGIWMDSFICLNEWILNLLGEVLEFGRGYVAYLQRECKQKRQISLLFMCHIYKYFIDERFHQ